MILNALTDLQGNMLTAGPYALSGSTIGTAAIYFLLEDHIIAGNFYYAGDTVTEGVEVPIGWVPTPNVDPLNTAAVQAFYAAGPRLPGPIRMQWSTKAVPAPVTYWKFLQPFSPGFSPAFGGALRYALTGLGSNQDTYPPINMV